MKINTKITFVIICVVSMVTAACKQKSSEPQVSAPSRSPAEQPVIAAPAVEQPGKVDNPPAVAESAIEEAAISEPATEAVQQPSAAVPAVIEAAKPTTEKVSPDAIVFKGDSFTVKSDQVLADVNGVQITLKDLKPINRAVPEERTVTAAEFPELLQKAIDREIVFQEARNRNLQLDDEQKQKVEKARLHSAAQGFSLPADQRQSHEDISNFESMELLAGQLTDGLAKSSGAPAKDKISEEEYQKYVRTMLDDLKSKAAIIQNAVIEP